VSYFDASCTPTVGAARYSLLNILVVYLLIAEFACHVINYYRNNPLSMPTLLLSSTVY
jgi:hypothetical protein